MSPVTLNDSISSAKFLLLRLECLELLEIVANRKDISPLLLGRLETFRAHSFEEVVSSLVEASQLVILASLVLRPFFLEDAQIVRVAVFEGGFMTNSHHR